MRIAVIDVGSNSVRLVVFDGAARSPAYFYNEKVLCGLGAGLAETGRLNVKGRARAMLALRRFAALLENMELDTISTVATAAVREATDGPDFCEEVRQETGLVLNVASGQEEARLSAQGVLLGWPEANGMVCDIGGASMELARLDNGTVGRCITSPLGPLILQDITGDIDQHIKEIVVGLHQQIGRADQIFLVGGSWRALARLDMARRGYPLHVLHEYMLTPEQISETARWVGGQNPDDLRGLTDTSVERLKLVPLAAKVMLHLVDVFAPKQLAISSYGIREGMLFEEMDIATRQLDPLIEACRFTETQNARFPGFGQALFDWLQPLYADENAAFKRLMLAACLLHDVMWRAHPDYRADMCFETVTQANMGAIDHQGRLFLALAIRMRYNSSKLRDHPALALLQQRDVIKAEQLGKAMRMGAMISGAQAKTLKGTGLSIKDGSIVLHLDKTAETLMGEVVEKRLSSLAKSFDMDAQIQRL